MSPDIFSWPLSVPPALAWAVAEPASESAPPLVQNLAVVFGILMVMLALIFWTSKIEHWFFRLFYRVVPVLLLCYFLPSLLPLFNVVSKDQAKSLYDMAKLYLLPSSLVLLTLSIDLQEIRRLGPKAVIMFLVGTLGVVIGGPLAILITAQFNPDLVGGQGPEAVWRGFTTVAGSWIGGGANQVAMKVSFAPEMQPNSPEEQTYENLYGVMVTVDIVVAELWMLLLVLGIGVSRQLDKYVFRADSSAIDELQAKMEQREKSTSRPATTVDLMVIAGLCFGCTAVSHALADFLAPTIAAHAPYLAKLNLDSTFFWVVMLSTTFGLLLSFTPLRKLEHAGCSRIGTVFIFILVATIGMKMNITEVFQHPGLFLVGGLWMLIHVVLLVIAGILLRAPYFFLAVGSKANIGGAASAPVVAAAFHPSLAPVGVLLAVLGYALGTYCAWICGLMMQAVAPP